MTRSAAKIKTLCLTGGPGAGKTAVTDILLRQCAGRMLVVPESASILYGGGFSRAMDGAEMREVQKAIYHIQSASEAIARHRLGKHRGILCDRGTLDGGAYWPSTRADFLKAVGSSLKREHARYDVVVHLESPTQTNGYDLSNPLRVENAKEAKRLDEAIRKVWGDHPKRYFVKSRASFIEKLDEVLGILRHEMPDCF